MGLNCVIMKTGMLPDGYSDLPDDCGCATSTSGGLVPRPELKIAAPANGIKIGRYSFSMLFINPIIAHTLEVSPSSSCGFTQCWKFRTYSNLAALTGELDTAVSAVGFSVNEKLAESGLVELDSNQRLALDRNDRPKKRNNLVFYFKMQNDAREARCTNILPGMTRCAELKLRGPAGFVFDGNCLSTLATGEGEVFGAGNKWPPIYHVWPDKVKISSCVTKMHYYQSCQLTAS